jgi:hypothetical protein
VTRPRKSQAKPIRRKPRAKPTPRLKPRPTPRLASDVVEEARLAITESCRMTDESASATLVLFALSRALRREHPALGRLAASAREVLDHMGEPVGVDELTHRRSVAQTMSKMLVHQRDALARTDPRRPPPLPAAHMASALSRMLSSGPLRDLYTSLATPERDGDAERILAAWARCVAADGCIHVDEDPTALARKLVVQALVALGVPRKAALDGLARKAPGKKGARSA